MAPLRLYGNAEAARHESDLPLDGAFAYPLDLPFSDDVHCLVRADSATADSW